MVLLGFLVVVGDWAGYLLILVYFDLFGFNIFGFALGFICLLRIGFWHAADFARCLCWFEC